MSNLMKLRDGNKSLSLISVYLKVKIQHCTYTFIICTSIDVDHATHAPHMPMRI